MGRVCTPPTKLRRVVDTQLKRIQRQEGGYWVGNKIRVGGWVITIPYISGNFVDKIGVGVHIYPTLRGTMDEAAMPTSKFRKL